MGVNKSFFPRLINVAMIAISGFVIFYDITYQINVPKLYLPKFFSVKLKYGNFPLTCIHRYF